MKTLFNIQRYHIPGIYRMDSKQKQRVCISISCDRGVQDIQYRHVSGYSVSQRCIRYIEQTRLWLQLQPEVFIEHTFCIDHKIIFLLRLHQYLLVDLQIGHKEIFFYIYKMGDSRLFQALCIIMTPQQHVYYAYCHYIWDLYIVVIYSFSQVMYVQIDLLQYCDRHFYLLAFIFVKVDLPSLNISQICIQKREKKRTYCLIRNGIQENIREIKPIFPTKKTPEISFITLRGDFFPFHDLVESIQHSIVID